MRYQSPESFMSAVEARLRSGASGSQTDLLRARRIVVFERALARLAVNQPGAWVLKGGAALEFRLNDRARATKDVDVAFSGAEPAEAAVDALIDALDHDPFGDWFSFQVIRPRTLSTETERGAVVRLTLEAKIGGRRFESVVVDLVSSEGAPINHDTLTVGYHVAFAELPLVDIDVIDLRTHWAEKLHAYCRRFDDRENTRVKDLVDLVLLIDHGVVADAQLYRVVEATFRPRPEPIPGRAVPSMADAWADRFAELATEIGLHTVDAHQAHHVVEQFWCQVLEAVHSPNPDLI